LAKPLVQVFASKAKIKFMSKTQKELAFLREFAIESDWTERFTDYFDTKFKFEKPETVLYVNAGAGTHAIALSEKLEGNGLIYAIAEDEDLRNIAQAKADAVKADVRFGTNFSEDKSDIVIADGSFVRPHQIDEFIEKLIDSSEDEVLFFLPTKGSFGEIFSFLWETLLETNLAEHGAQVERLISEIPTIEELVDLTRSLGLRKVEQSMQNEVFEYKDGAEFVNSPLVADFLLPMWLDFLNDEEKEIVSKKLAELIDAEVGTISFYFSVKNTLISGKT
jgi:predicted RNA methylase